MNTWMKKYSFNRLASIALAAVSAGVFLNFPVHAFDSTARSKHFLAQGTPSEGKPLENTPSPSKPSEGKPLENAPSPSKPSEGTTSQSTPNAPPTTPKDSQSIKDSNLIPGSWTCLNNPNSRCRS